MDSSKHWISVGLGVAGARCVAALGPDGRIRRGRDDCQAIIIAPARKDSALAVVFDFDGQKSLKEQRGPALSRPAPSRPPGLTLESRPEVRDGERGVPR